MSRVVSGGRVDKGKTGQRGRLLLGCTRSNLVLTACKCQITSFEMFFWGGGVISGTSGEISQVPKVMWGFAVKM